APSLLRTRPLLGELSRLYRYDSSIPTSGGLFPMPNNGCASARPFRLQGLWEIPLSMPRDGSLRFLGHSAREILAIWQRCAGLIAASGGVVMLLTHCEQRFSGNPAMLNAYRGFLEWVAVEGRTFTPAETRTLKLRRLVVALAAGRESPCIVEIGCGTGSLIAGIAADLPQARCIGLDISAENIAAARHHHGGGAVLFLAGDYLTMPLPPCDLLVADSVLQNIPCEDATLAAKLAADLLPEGRLAANMPKSCSYNRFLWSLRRLLRLLPRHPVEAALLAAARHWHPDWNPAMIRERLPYMYLLPFRHHGARWQRALAACGLVPETAEDWPHASPAQPKHRVVVHRKGEIAAL
ncbi:MAG: methyltransferase domain-containing protein, partial [Rhodospirillales bacterium]|nr:methyltransferase domain-containing protein [Rhodospirillales bacterium]